MVKPFGSVEESTEAFYAAVRKFHDVDYDSVDELEEQEEELIEAARLTIEYLAAEARR
jgi:hypothetical protein